MSGGRPADYLVSLVRELCALPRETEWVEFKVNEAEPRAIGEYISALANAAALVGKAFAYLVWGVRDQDHAIVGTTFDPYAAKVGNEELESWLLRLLEPKIDFRFFMVEIDGHRVVLLEIARAARHFLGQAPGWMGAVYRDPKVAAAVRRQRPVLELFPDCAASRCYERIAMQLASAPAAAGHAADYWRRLMVPLNEELPH